jgi:hypothetical protein
MTVNGEKGSFDEWWIGRWSLHTETPDNCDLVLPAPLWTHFIFWLKGRV